MPKKGAPFRRKREDTLVGTVEKQYGVTFYDSNSKDVRSDMKLGRYLRENGLPSLSKALESVERASNKKK